MENKSQSQNVTESTEFRKAIGDLVQYNEDLTIKGFDDPTISLSVSEDVEKHKKGIARLTIKKGDTKEEYLVHIDGIMTTIYASYAKTLNELKEPSSRMSAVRMQVTNKLMEFVEYIKTKI